jgi:RNA polymerase sigma-70 factor (ECF subfamily)
MSDGDDVQLVRRCLRGDTEAYEVLVRRYERVVFNVAYRMVGRYEDARDVAQTAFAKAYEKLGTYDPQYRFFSWLYRIAMNESLNLLQRRRSYQPLDATLADSTSPQEEVVARERSQLVQRALMSLSPDYREVIVLRHYLELSYREISAQLELPEKTVKSRLYTARQRLGELLGRSLDS